MIYYYHFKALPRLVMAYSVIRRTVWRIADPYQILIFIKSGHCRIRMDGAEYRLGPGDVFYLPRDCQYERRPEGEEFCEMVYLHFVLPTEGETLDRQTARKRLEEPEQEGMLAVWLTQQMTLGQNGAPEGLLAEMIRCCEGTAAERQLAAVDLCRLLALLTARTAASVPARQGEEAAQHHPVSLQKALSYVAQHYTEKITLDDLSAAGFVSKQMMIRYFREAFGKTPVAYVIEYKVDKIKQMLMTYPEVSIKELCGEFGFDDQCYFSRIFRKVTGESPSAYRSRVTHFDEKRHLKEPAVRTNGTLNVEKAPLDL